MNNKKELKIAIDLWYSWNHHGIVNNYERFEQAVQKNKEFYWKKYSKEKQELFLETSKKLIKMAKSTSNIHEMWSLTLAEYEGIKCENDDDLLKLLLLTLSDMYSRFLIVESKNITCHCTEEKTCSNCNKYENWVITGSHKIKSIYYEDVMKTYS